MLYPGSRFRMAEDLQETYIRQLLEGHARSPEVVVAWQGGEPTMMGLDFFRRSIELERKYAAPGQRVLNTIQTNGTLLDDEWGGFLKENDFLVGISVDGPREMHDAYRVDKGGKPTFDRVMRGLDVLRRHEVDWNVLTTIHAVNGDHGRQVYAFLRDELGAKFIQFIPIIERATEQSLPIADSGWGGGVKGRPLYTQEGNLVTHRSVGPQQYGRFMIDVFEEWVRRDIGTVYVQMFDTALANFYGEPGGMCVHAKTCGQQLAIEHNGDLYSCDHYVEPGYLLGNIGDRHMLELVASPRQRKFGQDKFDTLTRFCLDCDVRFACNGGCPKDRFAVSGLRRAGPALPVPELQGVLPPRRGADGHHGRIAAGEPGPRGAHAVVRGPRRAARPQRTLPLRRRPQMETLPRCPAGPLTGYRATPQGLAERPIATPERCRPIATLGPARRPSSRTHPANPPHGQLDGHLHAFEASRSSVNQPLTAYRDAEAWVIKKHGE